MGLDVFGRALSAAHHAARGPPGIGINLTKDGHYDMQKKRITNVGNPENPCDCTPYGVMTKTLEKVEIEMRQIKSLLNKLEEDMKGTYKTNLTEDGNFNMQMKRITNLGIPQHVDDCIPLGSLIERLKPVNEALGALQKLKIEEQQKAEENAGKLDYIIKKEIPSIHDLIMELYRKRGFFG